MRSYSYSIVVMALLAGGCVKITGEVYTQAEDPGPFVQVTSVDGTTIALEGGEQYRIRGIDPNGLSPDENDRLDKRLEELLLRSDKVVAVRPLGQQVTLEISSPAPLPAQHFVHIILFPKVVKLGPIRQDVAARVLSEGLARADVSGVDDERRKRWYLDAVREAKESRKGVWLEETQQMEREGKGANGRGPERALK